MHRPTRLYSTHILPIATLLLLVLQITGRAQGGPDECSSGTRFYVAIPDTTMDQTFAIQPTHVEFFNLLIYSPVDQQVTITKPGGSQITVRLNGGVVNSISSDQFPQPIVAVPNIPSTNVYEVTSSYPIIMYVYLSNRYGSAGFTPLPVGMWGSEHFVAAWTGERVKDVRAGANGPEVLARIPAPAVTLIIAAYDDTRVTIRPTAVLLDCSNCTSVTLMKGEAYLVESAVDTNSDAEHIGDIAGTYIASNRPIGLISGNNRLQIEAPPVLPLTGNGMKDLALEWIPPIDQHGSEFVFMPTIDDRQQPGADPARLLESVRLYGTEKGERVEGEQLTATGAMPVSRPMLNEGEFSQERLNDLQNARLYRTSGKGMAYQSPQPVVDLVATSAQGSSYDLWGTSMVQMVPREQWVNFAPFYPPIYPIGMKHYLNVVTEERYSDSLKIRIGTGAPSPFSFNRGTVPGTNLVWGTRQVVAGTSYVLEGSEHARFGAYLYGSLNGREVFSTSGTDQEKGSVASSMASSYQEVLAEAYAFPLAYAHCLLNSPDDYLITQNDLCHKMEVKIQAGTPNPSGIRYVRLASSPDSLSNLSMQFVEPASPDALLSKLTAKAVVQLTRPAPKEDAWGILEFRDRTREGEVHRLMIDMSHDPLQSDRQELQFGTVTVNRAESLEVMIINPSNHIRGIREIYLTSGGASGASIVGMPEFDSIENVGQIILPSPRAFNVTVAYRPTQSNDVLNDTLVVLSGCEPLRIPLHGTGTPACLFVGDLDFGRLHPGQSRTLPLELCNSGEGVVTFHDSTRSGGGEILSWNSPDFSVSAADIARLKSATLRKGECITIAVTLTAPASEGELQTTGRFWASTRSCRDTSRWNGTITSQYSLEMADYNWGDQWVVAQTPCTRNVIPSYPIDRSITNISSNALRVDSLRVRSSDGAFILLNSGTITPARILDPQQSETVQIAFLPVEQHYYRGELVLYYVDLPSGRSDSAVAILGGRGIESCLAVDDLYFEAESVGTSSIRVTKIFTIRATGTRPTTIRKLWIVGDDSEHFEGLTMIGPNRGIPFTLQPGDSQEVAVTFAPKNLGEALSWTATINFLGDFAYADCPGSCSDSSMTLFASLLTSSVDEKKERAHTEMLLSVLPSPLTGASEIRYRLEESGATTIEVYNGNGQLLTRLLDEVIAAGEHRLRWDASGLPSGVYLITIRSGERSESRVVQVVR